MRFVPGCCLCGVTSTCTYCSALPRFWRCVFPAGTTTLADGAPDAPPGTCEAYDGKEFIFEYVGEVPSLPTCFWETAAKFSYPGTFDRGEGNVTVNPQPTPGIDILGVSILLPYLGDFSDPQPFFATYAMSPAGLNDQGLCFGPLTLPRLGGSGWDSVCDNTPTSITLEAYP